MNFNKDASRSEKLVHELDNVPRAFAIGKLKQLETVPELSEQEGRLVGMIMEDHSIACVDEALLKSVLHPLITEHMTRTMPGHSDFEIGHSRLLLSRGGEMALAVDFVVGDQTHTGYVPTALHASSKATWPQYILLPPGRELGRCVKERDECREGSCWWLPGSGCVCVEPGNTDESGCVWW